MKHDRTTSAQLSTAWAAAKIDAATAAIRRGDMTTAISIEIELSRSQEHGAPFACRIVTDALIIALAEREDARERARRQTRGRVA